MGSRRRRQADIGELIHLAEHISGEDYGGGMYLSFEPIDGTSARFVSGDAPTVSVALGPGGTLVRDDGACISAPQTTMDAFRRCVSRGRAITLQYA